MMYFSNLAYVKGCVKDKVILAKVQETAALGP